MTACQYFGQFCPNKNFSDPTLSKSVVDYCEKAEIGLTELANAGNCVGPELLFTLFGGMYQYVSFTYVIQHYKLLTGEKALPVLRQFEKWCHEQPLNLLAGKTKTLFYRLKLFLIAEGVDVIESAAIPVKTRREMLAAAIELFIDPVPCFNPAYQLLNREPDNNELLVQKIVARLTMTWHTMGVRICDSYHSEPFRISRIILDRRNYPEDILPTMPKHQTFFPLEYFYRTMDLNLLPVSRYQVVGFPFWCSGIPSTMLLKVVNGQLEFNGTLDKALKKRFATLELKADNDKMRAAVMSILKTGSSSTDGGNVSRLNTTLHHLIHPHKIKKQNKCNVWRLIAKDHTHIRGIPHIILFPSENLQG